MAEALIFQLQHQAQIEKSRLDRQVDDDRPCPPECDALSNPQSRRTAMELTIHG